MKNLLDRYVVSRDRNIVCVDFRKNPEPPAPRFPGGAALRAAVSNEPDHSLTSMKEEVA